MVEAYRPMYNLVAERGVPNPLISTGGRVGPSQRSPDEVSEMSDLQSRRSEVLRGMRSTAREELCELRPPALAVGEILSGMRLSNRRL